MSNNSKPQQAPAAESMSELKAEITKLKDLIVKKDDANATRKKMLKFMVAELQPHLISHMIYAMADICTPEEIGLILDYMMENRDDRDGAFIDSFRAAVVDITAARQRMPAIKAQSLAAMADKA